MGVDIAVPTFNCGKWIDDFIKSIVSQDYQNWHIITRDDGSTDDTLDRISDWSKQLGERMTIIPNEKKLNCGPVGSYNIILGASTAQYVMLGDPDDIWKPSKISYTIKAMSESEDQLGIDTPIAIFTDAEVVNEYGAPLASSYWKINDISLIFAHEVRGLTSKMR